MVALTHTQNKFPEAQDKIWSPSDVRGWHAYYHHSKSCSAAIDEGSCAKGIIDQKGMVCYIRVSRLAGVRARPGAVAHEGQLPSVGAAPLRACVRASQRGRAKAY
eukprot:1649658-Pleurochrysis_carterae.AAC.1